MPSIPAPSPEALEDPRAERLRFDADNLYVLFADGRELRVPLSWFPTIASLDPRVRDAAHLIGEGTVIAWETPEFEEYLSVLQLLGLPDI
jgi:Protein of unknown function (DUF2442)